MWLLPSHNYRHSYMHANEHIVQAHNTHALTPEIIQEKPDLPKFPAIQVSALSDI